MKVVKLLITIRRVTKAIWAQFFLYWKKTNAIQENKTVQPIA